MDSPNKLHEKSIILQTREKSAYPSRFFMVTSMSVGTLRSIFLTFIQIIFSILMPLPLSLAIVIPQPFVIITNVSFCYLISIFSVCFFLLYVLLFSFMSSLFFPSMLCFSPLSFLSLFFLLCLQNIRTRKFQFYISNSQAGSDRSSKLS